MNREILFRGKSKTGNFWVYGHYANTCQTGDLEARDYIFLIGGTLLMNGRNAIPIQSETLGQFTGMKDKIGKEIFEGDILKCNRTLAVTFINGCFMWGSEPLGYNFDVEPDSMPEVWPPEKWATIVGNIHDNPELLIDNK